MTRKQIPRVPSHIGLMNPTLKALFQLGGSGSDEEILKAVIAVTAMDEAVAAVPLKPGTSSQTKLAYRLAWARTYLKKAGYLEHSDAGTWSLTQKARHEKTVNVRAVKKLLQGAGPSTGKNP